MQVIQSDFLCDGQFILFVGLPFEYYVSLRGEKVETVVPSWGREVGWLLLLEAAECVGRRDCS